MMGPSLFLLAVTAALVVGDSSAFLLSPHGPLQVSPRPHCSLALRQNAWLKKTTNSHLGAPHTTRYASIDSGISEPTASAVAAAVSGSTVELIEPETGSRVILLGCFHGSQSSAADVSACVTPDTNVVCMELCASRFADLRRDLLQEQQDEATKSTSSSGKNDLFNNLRKLWILRYAEMVQKKVQSRGLSTGMAAALLGGVSGMQTALSGLEPGLEFRRALEEVQTLSSTNDSTSTTTHSCDIVLADQNVDETLQKVGQLPSLAVSMWKECLQHGWESSFGVEASALKTALAGSSSNADDKLQQQVTIWEFLTRNPAAVRDMGRLVIPPMLLLQALAWNTHDASSSSVGWLFQTVMQQQENVMTTSAAAAVASPENALMTLAMVAANWLFLWLGYVSVALPVARVVLRERDDTLASGILQACRMAKLQQEQQQQCKGGETDDTTAPIRVVAVLGFLHVNGVAERLLKQPNHDRDARQTDR